jgi:RAB protein geranylgeranyltransferase component A
MVGCPYSSSDLALTRIDIYIAVVSSAHNVCPKGYYIAIVSTIAEGDSNHHLELQPGLDRLGKIEEQFVSAPIPLYEPIESGEKDNIFLSKSYDATSHFETTTGTCHAGCERQRLTDTLQMTSRTFSDALRGQSLSLKASGKVPLTWKSSARKRTVKMNRDLS